MGSSTVTSTTEEPPLTESEPTTNKQEPFPTNQSNSQECDTQSTLVESHEKPKPETEHIVTNDEQSSINNEDEVEFRSHEKDSSSGSNTGSVTPVDPQGGDEDGRLASNDLQFKKKDLKRPRTQSFQLVLSTASLKSLRQTDASNPPALQRNSSYLANQNMTGGGNHKNFQSFIQAPVLLSVSNLRALDNIVIGQQLPFDQKDSSNENEINRLRHNSNVAQGTTQPLVKDDRDDDDEYKEETILQQQKLTLNALKKLSLSLAPIIRSDEDVGPESRQLTTKLLNSLYQPEPKLEQRKEETRSRESIADQRTKPYQPAQVDLSLFASLTRQTKHLSEIQPMLKASDDHKAKHNDTGRDYHMEMQKQMKNIQNQSSTTQSTENSVKQSLRGMGNSGTTGNSTDGAVKLLQSQQSNLNFQSHDLQQSQSQMLLNTPQGQQLTQGQSHNQGMRQKNEGELDPVVPPMDMNVRHRKSSPTDETTSKHVSMADKRIQQIKGFRNPMYIPAVLRKTLDKDADLGPFSSGLNDGRESYFEGISRVGLPGRNAGSSSNSLRSVELTENLGSPSGLAAPLNKKQYEHILKAAPTRRHWLKDEAVSQCGIDTCRKQFNFFERRHHCRRCGGIFCKEHTLHYLYINHLAQFTTGGRGTLSRVCDNCIEEYNDFMKQEFGVTCHRPKSSMEVSNMPIVEPTETALPSKAPANTRKDVPKPKNPHYRQRTLSPLVKIDKNYSREEQSNEQVAGSVPANWSWSSF